LAFLLVIFLFDSFELEARTRLGPSTSLLETTVLEDLLESILKYALSVFHLNRGGNFSFFLRFNLGDFEILRKWVLLKVTIKKLGRIQIRLCFCWFKTFDTWTFIKKIEIFRIWIDGQLFVKLQFPFFYVALIIFIFN